MPNKLEKGTQTWTDLFVECYVNRCRMRCHRVPSNEVEGREDLLVCALFDSRVMQERNGVYVHWSFRATRKPWSTVTLSLSIASSKLFTISTSRPFCVPSSAPMTIMDGTDVNIIGQRSGLPPLTEWQASSRLKLQAGEVLGDVENWQRMAIQGD